MKLLFTKFLLFICIFCSSSKICAQNLYGGIEIGRKGLKMYVLDARSVEKNIWVVNKFWSENIDVEKGVVNDELILENDINKIDFEVNKNIDILKTTYKIDDKKIFIVISSGFAVVKNLSDVTDKIFASTYKKCNLVTVDREAELFYKSCVPPKLYSESFIIDIGGGNTKGCFVEKESSNVVYNNLSIDLGTVTLTELINKNSEINPKFNFQKDLNEYLPKLDSRFKSMYQTKPKAFKKKNVFVTGGSPWAFFTLFHMNKYDETNLAFTLEEVQQYDDILKNNFEKYLTAANSDKEIKRVLSTYKQESLIAANTLLLTALQNIPNLSSKKVVFAKQPDFSWLTSFIAEYEYKNKRR